MIQNKKLQKTNESIFLKTINYLAIRQIVIYFFKLYFVTGARRKYLSNIQKCDAGLFKKNI